MKKKIVLFLGLFFPVIIPFCYAMDIPRPEYPLSLIHI